MLPSASLDVTPIWGKAPGRLDSDMVSSCDQIVSCVLSTAESSTGRARRTKAKRRRCRPWGLRHPRCLTLG